MVATARMVKQEHPESKVVFIGPCASKKLEVMRKTVRSDVDFVVTFEELSAMFDAKDIDPSAFDDEDAPADATAAGRGYAVAGGVAVAIMAGIIIALIVRANQKQKINAEYALAGSGSGNLAAGK